MPMNPRLMRPLARKQAPAPEATDPYFSSVSLLLHFDGSFADSSSNAITVSAAGDAEISTAQSKFGTASAYFDGDGDYMLSATSSSLEISSGDFTIEFWIRFGSDNSGQQVLSMYGNGSPNLALYVTSTGRLDYYMASTAPWNVASGELIGNFSNSTWHHVALVRDGDDFTGYLDGVAGDTVTSGDSLVSGDVVQVGRSPDGGAYFVGHIDDLRITKGIARYTAAFTPPTAPFPNSGP